MLTNGNHYYKINKDFSENLRVFSCKQGSGGSFKLSVFEISELLNEICLFIKVTKFDKTLRGFKFMGKHEEYNHLKEPCI